MYYKRLFNNIAGCYNLNKGNHEIVKCLSKFDKTPFSDFSKAPSFQVLNSFRKFNRYGTNLFREHKVFKDSLKEFNENMKKFKKDKSNIFFIHYIENYLFKKNYGDSDKEKKLVNSEFLRLFKEKYG